MWRKQEHDRSWALPRLKISDIFLILEIEETFLTIKCIGGQKKGGVKLHIDLFTCLRDRHAHTGVPPDKPYTDSEPGKARWLAKGNPEEMPRISKSNYHESMTLWAHPCVYPHVLFFFFLNEHFTGFTTYCAYVEIHFCKIKGPGPCHWPLV